MAEERGGNNSEGVGIGIGVGKAERTIIPGCQVAAPGGGWQAIIVAGLMAIGIVDLLEVVKVEHE